MVIPKTNRPSLESVATWNRSDSQAPYIVDILLIFFFCLCITAEKNETHILLLVCRMTFMRPAQQCMRRWSSQLRCVSWTLTRTSSRTLWIRRASFLTCKPFDCPSGRCTRLLQTDAVHAVHAWNFNLVCDCVQSSKNNLFSCVCLHRTSGNICATRSALK